MKITDYSKDELIEIVSKSQSFKDVLVKMKNSTSGNAYKRIKNYLISQKIDISHLQDKRWSSKEKSIDEVFITNSNFCTKALKLKILKFNLLSYCCAECTNTGEWNGKKLSLHLDHKNGDNTDNRLENLRFLCPNCHSQTPTYSGKNKHKG